MTSIARIISVKALLKNFRKNYFRIFRKNKKKVYQKVSRKKTIEPKTIFPVYDSNGKLNKTEKTGSLFNEKL